jgi:serine phosphatase RsbU (regulator of sigma subunit)
MNKLFACIIGVVFQLQATICFSQTLNSPSRAIDSLKNILQHPVSDTDKVNTLNRLSVAFFDKNFGDSAMRYCLTAKTISENINYKRGLGSAYSLLANIYYYKGNYSKALENNLEALKIREASGDKKRIADSYNNIGNVYLSMNNVDEALKFHFKALKTRETLKDLSGLSSSYNNIGNCYQKNANHSEALKFHLASLKLERELNATLEIARSLGNIGAVYSDSGNFKKALEYEFESLKLAEELDDKEALEIALVNLGYIYYKMKDYPTAEKYALEALALATEIGDIETIIEANLQLSTIYKKIKNFEKSLNYYTTYVNIRDSLFNAESINKTIQAQLQYEYDKTAAAAKLEREKTEAVAKIESTKQKIVLGLVCFVLLLVIIFAIFTYRNYLQKQKANKIILRQKVEVEKQKSIIEEKNKDITGSITYAQRIQEAILPSIETVKKELPDSFVIYKPKDIIGGDFYWVSDAVTKYQEKFNMVAVADCTGHGVPGALMSIIGNNYLRLCEREPTVNRPSEALDFINIGISRTLRQEYSKSTIHDGMDMVFVAIDYNKSVLHFAGAKNPIYIVRSGVLTEYKGDKHPIGAFIGEEMKKFTNHTIPIEKGDCVYLFTDGYADQSGGPKGKKFMYSKFKEMLTSNSHLSMEEQKSILINTFNDWMGDNEQVDDVCVVGLRI